MEGYYAYLNGGYQSKSHKNILCRGPVKLNYSQSMEKRSLQYQMTNSGPTHRRSKI